MESALSKNKNAAAAATFFAFMFLQYVVLRFGNQAGRGFLSDAVQENVYRFIQIAAVIGFLSFAPVFRLIKSSSGKTAAALCGLGVFFCGSVLMFFFAESSAFYLAVTFLTVFALGFTGAGVYLKMASYAESGVRIGICTGAACTAATALQYFLQLHRLYKIPLGIFMLVSFAILGFVFSGGFQTSFQREGIEEPSPARPLVFALIIAFAMMLFTGYYNGYIHHLQIASGYSEYNVYTWPRLCMIPGFLLFGALGDLKKGRFLPLATLCVSALALMNAVLAGQSDAYLLNMCLFYIAISAVVSYYDLTFFRLAAKTKRPALWAPAGRVLDSLTVLFVWAFDVSSLSAAAVLAINIAALTAILLLMALNGDFDFSSKPVSPALPPAPEENGTADVFEAVRNRYGLTPSELKVFRELVLTEDKQTAIADRLSIKIRTVQANVTSIYRKTGVSTRSGLVAVYHDSNRK